MHKQRARRHACAHLQVGGRSVVNADISQTVEIRPEGERFFRLLEILGEWYEQGKTIIFVQSQVRTGVDGGVGGVSMVWAVRCWVVWMRW